MKPRWMAVPLALVLSIPAAAQTTAAGAPGSPTGLEIAGIPALNYDADEGFGYGLIAELYDYGAGGRAPYVYMAQPKVFLTTGGRRDLTLFFDAPHLIPGWRVDAYLASETQIASPYYGTGNDAAFDETLEGGDNPYWYRFGRSRTQLRVNLQKPIGVGAVRVLFGGGLARTTTVSVPRDSGTTLLATQLSGAAAPRGWSNYLRFGVVRDTRDREIGPGRGSWTEALVQRVDRAFGSESSYTRWTVTDRRYVTFVRRLVFANRLLLQGVEGAAPFYDLSTIESSYKQEEGLGGAKSLRGIPKNRFIGNGLFLWNAELRWRVADFTAAGRRFHVVTSAFHDAGRVWGTGVDLGSLLTDLHRAIGGGVRLGMGQSFVVAVDAGHSGEATLPVYIGLGYLY